MLVVPAPLLQVGGRCYLDSQACNGLRLWLDHFDRLILCAPCTDGDVAPAGMSDIRALFPDKARLELCPLPTAFTPVRFLRALPSASRLLSERIDRSSHLQFAIGGAWGDWGALAAIFAHRRGRKAAVWTDRVESQVMRLQADRFRGVRRLYRRFNAWLAERLERHVIRRAPLGLFHGMDTYRAYARFSPDPQLVHDIHLGPECRIAPDALAAKQARRDPPLRIAYAGRVHPDKGVSDWIDTLALLRDRIAFSANWYGEGPAMEDARRRVEALGLSGRVSFSGVIDDREQLMAELRSADIFLFCHQTPESPRCLVEALLCGAPIVGYASDYPADLIAGHQGGVLTPHEPGRLAAQVAMLADDRERLAALCAAAAADGFPMVDSVVFAHRSDLIKRIA